MAEPPPFSGFGPDALGFLTGLGADNSKSYFDDNREIYDQQVAGPMKSLVLAVGEQLRHELGDGIGPELRFEPKVGRSLFRINRDLRFSKDKTPYNTHLDAAWWAGGDKPKTSPAFIMRITDESVLTGVGVYGMTGDRLDRWRAAIDGDAGAELVDLVEAASTSLKGATVSEPTRKRVPPGFAADHPRARYLRHDSLHLSATAPVPKSITSARFATWVADRHVRLAPVLAWFVEHLTD
jgi:uncharacterized protein (TIGR02453 family)